MELAFLGDASLVKHIDQVGVHDGFDSVSHCDGCNVLGDFLEGLLDQSFVSPVQS